MKKILFALLPIVLIAPQFALAHSCSISFDQNPIAAGQGTYLRWSAVHRQCTDKPYCQGANLVDGCTGDTLQQCEWGCFYGRCNEVPKPTASLKAIPSLVHSGNTSKISWTSQNTTSCTVTSTGGDKWTPSTGSPQTSSGQAGKTSKVIRARTTFTLLCNGYKNSDPATVQKSIVVNIAPTYEEK